MSSVPDLVASRRSLFTSSGGAIRTTSQQDGPPAWLNAARERFRASHPFPAEIPYWQQMLADALYADGEYTISVAFSASGEVVGASAVRRAFHTASHSLRWRAHDRADPKCYLAYLGSDATVPGTGTALLGEVARFAARAHRPVFAFVSRAGDFYTQLGWQCLQRDPNGDHWLWPQTVVQEVAQHLTPVPQLPPPTPAPSLL